MRPYAKEAGECKVRKCNHFRGVCAAEANDLGLRIARNDRRERSNAGRIAACIARRNSEVWRCFVWGELRVVSHPKNVDTDSMSETAPIGRDQVLTSF
jgi:hypothetical protein